MKWLFNFSVGVALISTLAPISSATDGKIVVEGAGAEQQMHKVIEFRDTNNKAIKRIVLDGGMVTKNGRKTRRAVQALAAEDGNRVVTVEEERDADEHNPYITRFASAAVVALYDAKGAKLCSIQTRAVPRMISKDGRAVAAIDQGINPESFEISHDVPGLKSIADLRGEASLTDSYLYVLNDSCQVTFSTLSAKGGWNEVLVSPSGRWLAYEEFESQVQTDHGLEYLMTVVDIQTGKNWAFNHGNILPKSIADSGEIFGQRNLGLGGPGAGEFIGTDGKKHRSRKRRVQYYDWKPGASEFVARGAEVEEDK